MIDEAGDWRSLDASALAPLLNPETSTTARSAVAARERGMSVGAARQAVSRLRRKFRHTQRQQIAATLHDPNDVQIDEELTSLQAALRE